MTLTRNWNLNFEGAVILTTWKYLTRTRLPDCLLTSLPPVNYDNSKNSLFGLKYKCFEYITSFLTAKIRVLLGQPIRKIDLWFQRGHKKFHKSENRKIFRPKKISTKKNFWPRKSLIEQKFWLKKIIEWRIRIFWIISGDSGRKDFKVLGFWKKGPTGKDLD